jgi:GSH-dependent disulfide-bond oxidoreductase
MIDVYYWTTPNGHKVTMFLEEAGLEYSIKPINISKGEQFDPAFLKISPNNKIPAIVDSAPIDGGKPISVFESGAILVYLAGKTGQFIPKDLRGQVRALEWVMWQMGGLGPMLGQNHHFANYAPEKIPYAIDRYVKETSRLYAVLDKQLKGKDFVLGKQYTIADMASYPWINPDRQGQDIDNFPNVKRWRAAIRERPATQRAYEKAKQVNPQPPGPRQISEAERKILFGQDSSVVK